MTCYGVSCVVSVVLPSGVVLLWCELVMVCACCVVDVVLPSGVLCYPPLQPLPPHARPSLAMNPLSWYQLSDM